MNLAISVNRWHPSKMPLKEILSQTGLLGWGSRNAPALTLGWEPKDTPHLGSF